MGAVRRDPRGDRTNLGFNLPRFLELVPPPGRATLDVGCGEGRLGAEPIRRGHRVVGVDRSPRVLAQPGGVGVVVTVVVTVTGGIA